MDEFTINALYKDIIKLYNKNNNLEVAIKTTLKNKLHLCKDGTLVYLWFAPDTISLMNM